tara:strand:+ start:58 stop:567 length:510 start_codon:yes stop_codon:yes gene_type:complete
MEKIKGIEQGDLLTFKTVDGNYRVIMCTETDKKSPQNFSFIALTYNSSEIPNEIEIRKESFWGCGTSKANYYKYSLEEQERMWTLHPEIKPFLIGGYNLIIWRKDFLKFRDRILKIGNLDIVNNIDKNGNYGINVSSWESLNNFFSVQIEIIFKDIGQKTFKIESIIKT